MSTASRLAALVHQISNQLHVIVGCFRAMCLPGLPEALRTVARGRRSRVGILGREASLLGGLAHAPTMARSSRIDNFKPVTQECSRWLHLAGEVLAMKPGSRPDLRRRRLLGGTLFGGLASLLLGRPSAAQSPHEPGAVDAHRAHNGASHGAMMTVGEVDHARNGFDPHEFLPAGIRVLSRHCRMADGSANSR